MTCIIRSKNKKELSQYTDVLGSEEAAYHVLSMNNGFQMEFTPYGEESNLFKQLLAKNNYSYEDAVKEKASMYYSTYFDKIGGDWTMTAFGEDKVDTNGEPKIDYTPEKIDFSDIVAQPIELTDLDYLQLSDIENNLIEWDMDRFVSLTQSNNKEQIISAKSQWAKEKQEKLINSITKQIIKAFGLEQHRDKDGNIYFTSKEKDELGRYKVMIQFCDYINGSKKGLYDQTERLSVAANVIEISLLDADGTTIIHELAHHYIRMFWDSEVVQNAVKKLDTGDRSEGWQTRLEEKIVDEITMRTAEASDFWTNLFSKVKMAFKWMSSPVKQYLLHRAALAFRVNAKVEHIIGQQYVLEFIDPSAKIAYQSTGNVHIFDFENEMSRYGIDDAIRLFMRDSNRFFYHYNAAPNSIWKDNYDAYCVHVRNVLSSIKEYTDSDINRISSVTANAFADAASKYTTDDPNYQAAQRVNDTVQEAIVIRQTLQQNQGGGLSTVVNNQNSDIVDKVLKKIIKSVKTRIYEYLHTVPKEAQRANKQAQLLERLQLVSADLDKLGLFLSSGIQELQSIVIILEEHAKTNYENLTSQQLYSFWNTIDAFYIPIINIITTELQDILTQNHVLSDIGTKLQQLNSIATVEIRPSLVKINKILVERQTHNFLLGENGNEREGALEGVLSDRQEEYTDENGNVTKISQKERFLYNFDDQLFTGSLFEDINGIQPYIGLSSRSRSMILRVARNAILVANAIVRRQSLKDIYKIMKLYKKALPALKKLNYFEIQSIFQEFDSEGNRTGYFVRPVNHGQYYKELNEERDRLINIANEKLKTAFPNNSPQIRYDSYNNPILPPADNKITADILQEYADQLDEWMCVHSERMFEAEYYRIRRSKLSPATRQAQANIQNRISAITSKAPEITVTTSSGNQKIRATWLLDPEDQQNLVELQFQYKQLGNIYYEDGSSKSGEELKIALEIQAFNKWKGETVSYNQNKEKFDAAIQQIRNKYGNNSTQEARFRKLNCSYKVNPEYFDFVMSKMVFGKNQELEDLMARRNDLKKLLSEFDKNNIDLEEKRRQTQYWDEMKEVEKEIRELIDSIPKQNVDPENMWSTYFDEELVMYDHNTSLVDFMIKRDITEYRASHPADTRTNKELRKVFIEKYQYKYTYHDENGEAHEGVRLLSVFLNTVPKGLSFYKSNTTAKYEINGQTHIFPNALFIQYSNQFSDVDSSSKYYNKNYDRQSPTLTQPKKELYSNSKQWSIIESDQDILNLYNALVQLMQDNNAKLPSNAVYDYKLPQVSARRMTILRRSTGLKEFMQAAKYNWENEWKLNDRDDDDVNYEDEEIKTRSDGTRINTVPVRYQNMRDPSKITSDVIGSIIAYTIMANNFQVKTQLASELELIKQQLSDRENPGVAKSNNQESTKNITKQLTSLMNDQLYGNTMMIGDKTAGFGPKEQKLIKFMSHFRHLGRILMLGWNTISMVVGYGESRTRGAIEAILGKNYEIRDFFHSVRCFWKYFPSTAYNAGSPFIPNLQIALMQHFGMSKSLKESYEGTERNKWAKLISQNVTGMWGFTMGDYINSSFQLWMALSNVRFIDNPSVPKGFYTLQTLTNQIKKTDPNISHKEARKKAKRLRRKSNVSLDDAYEFSEDGLSVKQEYIPYVYNRLEDRVTGKLYQRLAESLGITPEGDNPGYSLQVLLKPFGALRTYMWTMISRMFNFGHDLQTRTRDENGKINKKDEMAIGYVDLDAGQMDISIAQTMVNNAKFFAQWLHILPRMQQNADPETKEQLDYMTKKVVLEILAIAVFAGIATLFKAISKGAKDDKWWAKYGYLTSVRLVNSFLSYLDPTSLLELIKNISTLISPLNDILKLISLLQDLIGISGHSPLEEIKSGSYKGRSRIFRNLMRVTPFGNLYEDLAIPSLTSRTNWYLQQDPLVWGSIGHIYDTLWGVY